MEIKELAMIFIMRLCLEIQTRLFKTVLLKLKATKTCIKYLLGAMSLSKDCLGSKYMCHRSFLSVCLTSPIAETRKPITSTNTGLYSQLIYAKLEKSHDNLC